MRVGMTGRAGASGKFSVLPVGMAAGAIGHRMRTRERVLRLVVIEALEVRPHGLGVAALARLESELIAVWVLPDVATAAVGG